MYQATQVRRPPERTSSRQPVQMHQQQQESNNPGLASNNFSFRMFDMYRRFVAILKQNPAFLADFKSGSPHEDTCKQVIRRTFMHRQSEERMAGLVVYLKKNAKCIVEHAEKLPSNWTDAIRYTDQCIKIVKTVLKEKGITLKKFVPEKAKVEQLARDVAKVIHEDDRPTDIQMQAIRDYLMCDLRNPKRTIATSTPKPSKRKKEESRSSYKVEKFDEEEYKSPRLRVMLKKINPRKPPAEGRRSKRKLDIKKEIFTSNNNESDEYLTISCDPVSRKFMELNVIAKSENEVVYNKSPNSSPENWTKGFYKPERGKIFGLPAVESATSVINPYSFSYAYCNESLTNNETDESNALLKKESNSMECNSKRKNSSDCNDIEPKKFITEDYLDEQNSIYASANEDNSDKTLEFQSIITDPIEIIEKNDVIDVESISNSEVNVVGTEEKIETPAPTSIATEEIEIKQLSIKTTEEVPIIKEIEAKAPEDTVERSKADDVEPRARKDDSSCSYINFYETACYTQSKEWYARARNISFFDAQKLTETVMAFCELNNAIELEEYVVLRRVRDKMHWRSLKESAKAQI